MSEDFVGEVHNDGAQIVANEKISKGSTFGFDSIDSFTSYDQRTDTPWSDQRGCGVDQVDLSS